MSVKTLPSNDLDTLIAGFEAASSDADLLRGFKRSLTLYCRNKESETGTAAFRFRAAVKMRLTKMGHDSSIL